MTAGARGRPRVAGLAVLLALLLVLVGGGASAAERPRVVVMTDISRDPDDEQSLVRLLVYANEFDIEGLIATTSVWLPDRVSPETIAGHVEAYGRVEANLSVHAEGFPSASQLRAAVKAGRAEYGMAGVGEGKSSEGSRHLVAVVDRPDPRPVWVLAWGGVNTLAQTLWDVRATRSPAALAAFVAKLRVYAISDQDDAGSWLRRTFPDLFYIVSPSSQDWQEYYRATWTGISGDRRFQNGPFHHFELVENPWLRRNVTENHGPLGARYPPSRHIMEGDTPSFLNLIGNGLGSDRSPAFGGWGGRYVLHRANGETRPIWTSSQAARDTVRTDDGREHTSVQATIWRWREAFQHDFAARMDWCVAASRGEANHNPHAVVAGSEDRSVLFRKLPVGTRVELDASASTDPDGDALRFRWWHYREAGTHLGAVTIQAEGPRASLAVPRGRPGRTVHVILEVWDDGEPSLVSYRRLVFTVAAPPKRRGPHGFMP